MSPNARYTVLVIGACGVMGAIAYAIVTYATKKAEEPAAPAERDPWYIRFWEAL